MSLKSKPTKAYVVIAAMILMASSSQAWAGWVTGMTVRNVRTMASTGEVTFATVEPTQNPSSCSITDFYGILSADNAKQALSVLLAAQTSGLKISFYILDGAAGCESNGRPRVADVMIGTF